jgi:hypothetical protein
MRNWHPKSGCFHALFWELFMRKLWKWVTRKATQGLLWVAVKMCQAIVFVVDTVEAVVEVVKETAKVAAEVAVEIIQQVRANKVVRTIGNGVDTLKKIKDMKEIPDTVRRIGKGVWAFATGKACFSWAASSGWCTLCSLGCAALLLVGFTFSLYLLGLLSTVFRS